MTGKVSTTLMDCCASCGKPPFRGQNGNIIPLKRCMRCKLVAYHDVQCQKAHFSLHRSSCRKRSLPSSTSSVAKQYSIRKMGNRGNCLLATSPLGRGDQLVSGSGRHFLPAVPPALHSGNRSSRCATCLSKITQNQKGSIRLSDMEKYPVIVCSELCRVASRPWIGDEISCIRALGDRIPVILPTSILVYRIVRGIGRGMLSKEEILSLQSHPLEPNDNASSHEKAVTMTVFGMVSLSNSNQPFPVDLIQKVLSCIKYNAFTIPDPSSGDAIGFGIFDTVYRINHSCDPNAKQTFKLGDRGRLPSVQITISRNILANEEITIAYIDEMKSKEERREALLRDYRFLCDCRKCLQQ